MASEVILESYKLTIDALAEKHGVSTRRVWMILADMSNEELAGLDWKDLDAVIQEGLAREGGVAPEEEPVRQITTPGWEQKIQYNLGHRSASQITASQEEYEKSPPMHRTTNLRGFQERGSSFMRDESFLV